MARTSPAGRFPLAAERAKSGGGGMPRRGAASLVARAASAPARCPAERGSLWEEAQRPLPSEMMATWREFCVEAGAGGGKRAATSVAVRTRCGMAAKLLAVVDVQVLCIAKLTSKKIFPYRSRVARIKASI